MKINSVLKNNYGNGNDENFRLPYKEKNKRLVQAILRCLRTMNAAFLVVN
jgi:hypothetical protein